MAIAQDPQTSRIPKWLELGGELRGRFEANTGQAYVPGNDDYYYLHRIRFRAGVQAHKNLRFFGEVRHTLVPGRNEPVPPGNADYFDIQQAYTEFSTTGPARWGARVGRQEIVLGGQRLVGAANWGNTGRNFDMIRLFRETKELRIDLFASMVTEVRRPEIDPFRPREQLQGLYITSRSWVPKGQLETYVFRKINNVEVSPLGTTGRTDHYTSGTRGVGKLPRRLDYNFENAFQWGTLGAAPHRAWAGYWILGYTTAPADGAPRVFAKYTYASGTGSGANRSGTFDMLYPTNHLFYGNADRMPWRNIHEAVGALDWKPFSKLLLQFQYHSFWLATRDDFHYSFNGRPVVRNPTASSAHIGHEFDINAVWDLTRRVQAILGYAHIFPGQYLKESTRGSSATVAFAQWRYSF